MITSGIAINRSMRLRPLLIPALFTGVFLICTGVLAAESAGNGIDWAHMAMGL